MFLRFRTPLAAFLMLCAAPACAQVTIPQLPDPLMVGLDIPADAATKGMWSPIKPWPLVGLHAALMPNGSVLTYGSPLGQGIQDGRTFDVWDPALGFVDAAHFTTTNAEAVDSFCSTAAFMTTGSMLITGGSSGASGYAATVSATFTPATNAPYQVKSTSNPDAPATLASPRWYASMITLPDGRPFIAGGSKPYATNSWADPNGAMANNDVSITPEVYTPGIGWKQLTGAASREAFGPENNKWWYPRMWVSMRGNVFGITGDAIWAMNPAGDGAIWSYGKFKKGFTFSDTDTPNTGPTSTAVMYDVGRILQVGGNGPANGTATTSSAKATVVDIRGNQPAIIEQKPMLFPRQWANATVVPTGQVIVTGGTRFADNAGDDAVNTAEIWTPSSGTWRAAAQAGVYRGYHSAVILLPNGALLSTGGGVPGPATNLNAEVYYPPYLFTRSNGRTVLASRPQVSTISATQFDYGATANLTLARDDAIDNVAIIGASSTTHSFNTSQRFIPASFRQNGSTVTVTMPGNANLAPPGYYLVFLLNRAGVPSNGVVVSLGGMAPVPTKPLRLTIGETIGLQSLTYTDQRVRHAAFLGYLARVTATSSKIDKDDSAFIVRKGLWRDNCYSFESRNYPGYFLRHQGLRLKLQAQQTDALYKLDTTFCTRGPLNGDGDANSLSLEPIAWPGFALRNRGGEIWLDRADGSANYNINASFRRVSAF